MKSLRTYLSDLRDDPRELVTIDQPISTAFEISAVAQNLAGAGAYPVVLCRSPRDAEGRPSAFPVVTNLLASRDRIARLLGVARSGGAGFTERFAQPIPPAVVDRKDAPVKEVVLDGASATLDAFPAVRHYPEDIGAYVTAGVVTTVDPDSGVHNSAIQRAWVKDGRTLPTWISMPSHSWRNVMRWWARGEDAPAAIWLGHHPAALAGLVSYGRIAGYPDDHYPQMGAALGEALRLVDTELFGGGLRVPADAEIVIEGVFPRGRYAAEGPAVDREGYVGAQRPNPEFAVRAITHRRDAMWHDIQPGTPDHWNLGAFVRESQVRDALTREGIDVIDAVAPPAGRGANIMYVRIRKHADGDGRRAARRALACSGKLFVIFDGDVDVFDDAAVLAAIVTRCDWERDLQVAPGRLEQPLDRALVGPALADLRLPERLIVGTPDPALPSPSGSAAKAALDCTRPAPPSAGLPSFYPEVARLPDAAIQTVRLERLLPPAVLALLRREGRGPIDGP
ncbi:MAG: hypothetical protein QOH08_50 [Chloroflexota bacterium]|nr:hypothetical protein [Chloroflexota bacterium]